jgi:hypothetical protein
MNSYKSAARILTFFLSTCGVLHALAGRSLGERYFLAEQGTFPGKLSASDDGAAVRVVHRREPRPDRAYPSAVMKLQHVAVGPDAKIYYCSGLDGSLMHLLDGRHEIQSCEFPGQIRDLATTGEEHTIYFSVVPTPQNGEPLADGKIYRRDFWEGAATEVATVRQSDVGGNWWGTFTIREGVVYLATLESPSRLFQLTGNGPQRVLADNNHRIVGLTTDAAGAFLFTTGDGQVWRTSDFAAIDVVARTNLRLSDIAVRPAPDAPRP